MPQMSLKAARVNTGYSQKEAAKKLNVSNRTLCKWENGVTYPNQPMIEKICELYQVPYDAINFKVN